MALKKVKWCIQCEIMQKFNEKVQTAKFILLQGKSDPLKHGQLGKLKREIMQKIDKKKLKQPKFTVFARGSQLR